MKADVARFADMQNVLRSEGLVHAISRAFLKEGALSHRAALAEYWAALHFEFGGA